MSRNVLERLLHRLCVDRREKQRFKEDLEGLLERHRLTEEEKAMLRALDVGAMQRHGVNPMLTIGFWFENAPDPTPRAYMKALAAPAARGPEEDR